MSLTIYTDMADVDRSKFIFDVETGFKYCGIEDNSFNRRVLKELEKGDYVDKVSFKDRFGSILYASCMSTSSKAYMCLNSMPNKIINFIEVVKGTGDLLLDNTEGAIFIPTSRLEGLFSSIKDRDIDVSIHGKNYKKYLDLIEYTEGL